jgi:hypothetical protein
VHEQRVLHRAGLPQQLSALLEQLMPSLRAEGSEKRFEDYFIQQNGFILRQLLFVLHPKLLNEEFFGEELCIFEIFLELITKITL